MMTRLVRSGVKGGRGGRGNRIGCGADVKEVDAESVVWVGGGEEREREGGVTEDPVPSRRKKR